MSTDTQINSFLIPADLWTHGWSGRPALPPLAIPAADALDIERRAAKRVGLRNESRRYTLCCERMQAIVRELDREPGLLPQPLLWPVHRVASDSNPSARAYLAIVEIFSFLFERQPDGRVIRFFQSFIPPDNVAIQAQRAEESRGMAHFDEILKRAAERASPAGSAIVVTAEECRHAFDRRCHLLQTAAQTSPTAYGIVDVVELA